MGTQEHFCTLQGTELLMVYGLEPQTLQPLAFYAVVYNIAQTEQLIVLAQFLLGLAYG